MKLTEKMNLKTEETHIITQSISPCNSGYNGNTARRGIERACKHTTYQWLVIYKNNPSQHLRATAFIHQF